MLIFVPETDTVAIPVFSEVALIVNVSLSAEVLVTSKLFISASFDVFTIVYASSPSSVAVSPVIAQVLSTATVKSAIFSGATAEVAELVTVPT